MRKITLLIEESFARSLGNFTSTVGTGLAGAGIGSLIGYDMSEPAELNPDTGEYEFDPETMRNMALGAGAGALAGGYIGNKAGNNQMSSTNQTLGAGVAGLTAGAAGLYAAGNQIPYEDLVGKENIEGLKNYVDNFTGANEPETPIDYIKNGYNQVVDAFS